jgi:ABC-type Zn uptake system ZnuABC Zn-binding protein ZnuA
VTRRTWLLAVVLTAGSLLGAACDAPATSPSPTAGGLTVVTTTTVFADLVAQVGGNRVDVLSLVPRGGDVHTFDPAPSDARAVARARLLVMNGLGLDDWLLSIVRDGDAANTPLLKLAEDLPAAQLIGGGAEGGTNPHLWMDVAYARGYASLIAGQLIELDPAGQSTYEANLAAYDAQLLDLDGWIRDQLASLPPDARQVVSFHDAFPYYARAYGLEVVGVVVPAPGQDPSAAQVAALIQAINDNHVRAILAEAQFNDRLAQTIAAETGAQVVKNLYDDSLGDPPIDSYEALMRWDTNQITAALR